MAPQGGVNSTQAILLSSKFAVIIYIYKWTIAESLWDSSETSGGIEQWPRSAPAAVLPNEMNADTDLVLINRATVEGSKQSGQPYKELTDNLFCFY